MAIAPGRLHDVSNAADFVALTETNFEILTAEIFILNATQGTLKRHAGGYSWETIIGVTGGKVGFYGATPVVQPTGADQADVTLGNTNGEIGGLTISNPPTQAEVQALRDACEELADDVRALSVLVHALRAALVAEGLIKGGV